MNFILISITLGLTVCTVYAGISSFDQTNEGNEFYVGFFHNRFGKSNQAEEYPPILWITTKEDQPVEFTVSTINGTLFTGFAKPQETTYVKLSTGIIVTDSTQPNIAERLKGINIKTKNGKKIVVYGQNEQVASNDAYLALPVITLPGRRSYEYVVASVKGDLGFTSQAKDSVALIVGTENDTEIAINPSVVIPNGLAPAKQFIPRAPANLNKVIIQRFQTFYLQVRGGDLSGTRITANKPISVFSGHECANVPFRSPPCDILIEQIPSVDAWGTEIVTIPLKTRKGGDIIKLIASQDATMVNITHTDVDDGKVTRGPVVILDAGQFKELLIGEFSLIQSNHPIGVFQLARSFTSDNVIISDPLMLFVPPYKQYLNSYAVATAPFEKSLAKTLSSRVAYINYTNIAVPAEFFNASLLIVNNQSVNASDFKPIRRADSSIWGYGAQLLLDEGAQIIKHHNPDAVLSVTLYGFSNQQSWGCTGGMGLAPIATPGVNGNNVTIFENDKAVVVQIERSGPLNREISMHVSTVNGTARAGVDFMAVSQAIKFSPGQTTASVHIPIIDDDVALEPNITFSVTITPKSKDVIVFSNSTVTIADNDHVPKIRISNITVFENDGTAIIHIERSEGLDRKIVMDFTTVDGTASAGKDYTTISREITFLSRQSKVIVSIPIRDDTISKEADIYFFIRIIFNKETVAQSVVTIVDNDHGGSDIVVEFSSSVYIGSESLKGVPVTLLITKGTISPAEEIVINIVGTSQSPVSAEGHKDYSSISVPVIFTSRTNKVSTVMPVFQDKIIEEIETFNLNINIPSSFKHRIAIGRQRKATASIIDSTITTCPANFKVIAMEKSNSSKVVQKEVRTTVKNALDLTENITTDEEAFTKIAETLKVENTTENFIQFQNAMNEISKASYEACYGPDNNLVLPGETLVLIQNFKKAVLNDKSNEARRIFGRLLCLKQKFEANSTSVVKRQATVTEEELTVEELALMMWFEGLSATDFPPLFGFDAVDVEEMATLAFVVDDTGSMGGEIAAVKDLIKAIIKAENFLPFFYILGTFNDPDVGVARRYDSYDMVELNQLKDDVEAIRAHSGGDCPELGMEGISRALAKSNRYSHVIVLTDASCKDCHRKDEIIATALSLNVKVHFFFSNDNGCGDGFVDYKDVQMATGGVSVNTIDSESFTTLYLFIAELGEEESKRSTVFVDDDSFSSYNCQTFDISIFTIKFDLVVKQNSKYTIIYDPLGYNITSRHISDDLSGYVSGEQPRNGSWRVCTADETSKYALTKKDILDLSVDYYQDGHYSSAIPTAGTASVLSVFTTRLDSILVDDDLTLSFISEDNKFLGSTPLLLCNGYLLGRIVIPNVKFRYRLSGNDQFGNPFRYTKKSPINIPRQPYFLENISRNKTVNTGSKTSIYFRLRSTYAATDTLNFNIVASTSPTELMLKYQTTVTVKPNDTQIIGISVDTKDSDTEGEYVVKVTASSDDLTLTSSQHVTLVKPDDSSCPCLNGGTCRYFSRRGRTFIACQCQTGYIGNRCQISN